MEKHRKGYYKYCVVPMCENNNKTAPEKVYFLMPKDEVMRKRWCKAMRRDNVSRLSCLYCCEDHFNIEKDTENYMQYKIMAEHGQKVTLHLKKGIVPHVFQCQKKDQLHPPPEIKGAMKRKRQALVEEALAEAALTEADLPQAGPNPKSKKATEEVQHGDQDDSDAADDPGSSEVNIPEPPPPPQLYLHSAHMCRVCLVLEVKMFDLRDTELNTMFQMTTGITFKEIKDSKLGRLICWECAARLKAASTFISKALFSESLLRGLIKKGNEIDKQYYESLKEDADNLISPKTLTVTEIVHIVEIEDQNNMTQLVQSRDDDEPALSEKSRDDDEPALSEKSRDDDEPALSENCETEEIIIYETENDQMDVEVHKDVPIETRIDDDPTCPYAEEQNRTELIKEIPLDSTASYKETINSGYSHPDDDTTCPYAEKQNKTKIIKVNPLDSTASCEETISSGYSHPLHRFLLLSDSTHQVDFEDQISKTFSIKTNIKFKKVPKQNKKLKNPIKRSKVGLGHYHKNYLKGDSEDGIKKRKINILRK